MLFVLYQLGAIAQAKQNESVVIEGLRGRSLYQQKNLKCTPEQQQIIQEQLSPENCGKPGNSCSFAVETRCPKRSWLAEYYAQVLASENVPDFLGISIGCNRAFDSIEFLRLATGNTAKFDPVAWETALAEAGVQLETDSNSYCSAANPTPVFSQIAAPNRLASMHCVDPMPRTIEALQEAALMRGFKHENTNQDLVLETHLAIGLQNGHAHFPFEAPAGAIHTNFESCDESAHESLMCEEVPVFSLDSYVQSYLQREDPDRIIDVIHINTDGYDPDVILGGKYVLLRTQYLEFEYHRWGAWRRNTLRQVIRFLDTETNFNCYWAGNRGNLWRINGDGCFFDYYENNHLAHIACANRELNPELAAGMERRFLETLANKDDFKPLRSRSEELLPELVNGGLISSTIQRQEAPPAHSQNVLIPEQPDFYPNQVIKKEVAEPASQRLGQDEFVPELLENLKNCPPTNQVELDLTWCGELRCPHVKLYSLDDQGQRKTMGGDEFYVTYWSVENESPAADAFGHIYDNKDGSYDVHFYDTTEWIMAKEWPEAPYRGVPDYFFNRAPPSSVPTAKINGKIKVIFQYTCGIGFMHPPTKEQWLTPGVINREYESAELSPQMRPHVNPSHRPSPHYAPWFSQYDAVICVGDSLMRQFFEPAVEAGKFNMMIPRSNTRSSLNVAAVNSPKGRWRSTLDTSIELVTRNLNLNRVDGSKMKREEKSKWLLMMGSMAWDILADPSGVHGPYFENHLEALESLIKYTRETYVNDNSRPFSLDIVWKSATAQHIQNVAKTELLVEGSDELFYVSRVKYASESRSRTVYNGQKELLERLDIPMMDIYNITLGAPLWNRENDATHYAAEFNEFLEAMYFDTSLARTS